MSGKDIWCFPSSGFTCHDHGATVLQYAPKQQLLISGGRKGCICIFDIRQRQLIHTFQAHDSAIKALALDPCEEYFTTGSAEGNIKVSQYKKLEGAGDYLCVLSRLGNRNPTALFDLSFFRLFLSLF